MIITHCKTDIIGTSAGKTDNDFTLTRCNYQRKSGVQLQRAHKRFGFLFLGKTERQFYLSLKFDSVFRCIFIAFLFQKFLGDTFFQITTCGGGRYIFIHL